jgi:transcriptional regulator with XRE-family HTH domain
MIAVRGEAVAEIRRRRHVTQVEMGAAIGLVDLRLRQIEKSPVAYLLPRTFRRLAEWLGQTPEQLLGEIGAEAEHRSPEYRRPVAPGGLREELPAGIDPGSLELVPEVPVFDLAIAAGGLVEVVDAIALPYPDGPTGEAATLREAVNRGRFRVRIAGDSMEPIWPNGAHVEFRLLRPEREGPVEGRDYYVQAADGRATFKRLARAGEDEMAFAAVNRRKYPKPIVLARQEVARLAAAEWFLRPAGEMGRRREAAR